MVGSAVVDAEGDLVGIAAVGIHYPDGRRAGRGRAAKGDLATVGRLDRAKSQTGGSLCVSRVTLPLFGSSRQISVPPRARSGL